MKKVYFLIIAVFLSLSTNLSAQNSCNNNNNNNGSGSQGSGSSCSNNNGQGQNNDDEDDDEEDEEDNNNGGGSCGNGNNGGGGNGGNNGGGSCGNGNNGGGGNGGNNGGGSCGNGNNGGGGNGGNNGGGNCGNGNNGGGGNGGNNGGGNCGNGNNGGGGNGGNNGGGSCGNGNNGGGGNGGNNGGGSCGNGNNGGGGNGGNNGGGSCGNGNNGGGGNGGNNGGGSCGNGNNGGGGDGGNNGGGSCGNGNNGGGGNGGNNGGGSCGNGNNGGNNGNNNNGNGGCNGNGNNNNEDDEEEDDENDNWNGGGSCGGNNGGDNNGGDNDNDDDEEGDDDDDDNNNNSSFNCPNDVTLYCDYNTTPEFTGVPTSNSSISISFEDEIISTACPFTIVRHWTIISNGSSATCNQTISVEDTIAPVITVNSNTVTSCEDLNNLSYTVTDCDPNPIVNITYTSSDVPPAENVDCNINGFRTQTQGGWGANPNGNNPAVYLYANFDSAFPNGLTIGCNNTLTLTSAPAITAFLPSGSTPSALPAGSMTNPGGTYHNVLAGQLVAAILNATFDAYDSSFGSSDSQSQDLIIASGTFQGMTVSELLQIANETIGGCNTSYSFSQVNAALTAFNENFDNGNQNNGFLDCPEANVGGDGSGNGGSGSNGSAGSDCVVYLNYTITATDACGNTSEVSGSFSYTDNAAPVFINAVSEVYVECGDEIPTVEVEDDCGNSSVTVTYVDSEFSGACIPTIERIYTATDACGNASTFTQYIFTNDTQAPVISGLEASVSISCSAELALQQPIITDACSDVEVSYSEQNNMSNCSGTLVRTWTAVDACGNASSFTQTVTIADNEAPVFTFIPADVQIYCGSELPTDQAQAVDNCGNVTMIVSDELIEQEGNCSYIQRVFRAQDDCGNMAIAMQTISLIDDVAPAFVNEPSDITISCSDIVPSSNIEVTDNCDNNVNVQLEESYFIDGCATIIFRMWTATDNCGNSVSTSQQITIADLEAPQFNMEEEITVACGVENNISVNITDNCTSSVQFAYTDEVFGDGCSYDIIRMWTASDDCGNTSTFEQLIHVIDNQAPVFTFIPPSFTAACSTPAELGTPVVTDNCSDNIQPVLTEVWSGAGCSQQLIRTWTATDACGNVATVTQTITIADNEPPVIVGVPQSYTVSCSEFVEPQVPTTVTAVDNCVGEPTLTFEESTVPGECTGTFTIVRTWTAFDECGNSTISTQTITVADTEAPTWSSIPQDIQIACGDVYPAAPQLTATDNCSNDVSIDFMEFEEQGSCGTTIYRSWYAYDECGNMAYLSQTISVLDTDAPVFVQTPDPVLEVSCGNIPAPEVLDATDNCSSVELYMTENVISTGCPYTIERTWYATDGCGNTSTFTQLIYVTDTEAPVIDGGISEMEVSCDNIPVSSPPAVSDCSSVQIFSEEIINESGCATQYDIVRIYTAIDLCGNTAEWIQTIHVVDNEAPILVNVPSDLIVGCSDIPVPANVYAIDNCENQIEVMFNEVSSNSSSNSQSCTLTTPDAIFGDVSFWLPGIAGVTENYSFASPGVFTQDLINGTATVDAVVVNNMNTNQRWLVHLEMANARNWTEWSALGRSYKDDLNIDNGHHVDWTYYELQTSSYAVGQGDLEGSTINLTHMPSTYYYGFQVGERANNRNTDYGMSGWFYYNGTVNGNAVSGHGDFFATNDCCEAQEIIREWTAIDCAGNVSTYTQTIQVQSAPAAPLMAFVAQREEPTISVNNTGDMFFRVSYTIPEDGNVSIDLYNSNGQMISKVFEGSAVGDQQYTIQYKVPSVENAMYFFRLQTKDQSASTSALMLR